METLPALTQLWSVDADRRDTFYHVHACARDLITFAGPARTRYANGVTKADWYDTHGGEVGAVAADPQDHNVAFVRLGAFIGRHDRRTDQFRLNSPTREVGETLGMLSFVTPIVISRFDHATIYTASDRVFKTTDRGESWQPISPALAPRVDAVSLMGFSQPAIAQLQGITALAESPVERKTLYAGTGRGALHVTRDAGAHWRRLELPRDVPAGTPVSAIIASRANPGAAYVAFNGSLNGDYRPHLFPRRTTARCGVR